MARSRMRGLSPEGRKRHDEDVALDKALIDRRLVKEEELFKDIPLQEYGQSQFGTKSYKPGISIQVSEHVRNIRLKMEAERDRRGRYADLVARGEINHRPEYADMVCKGNMNFDEWRKQTVKDNKPNVFEQMLSGKSSDISPDRLPGHSELMNHYFDDDGLHKESGSEKVADLYLIHLTDNEAKELGVTSQEIIYRENADRTKQILVSKAYDDLHKRYEYQPIINGEYSKKQVDKALDIVDNVMQNRYSSFTLDKDKVLEGAKYSDTVRRMPKNLPEVQHDNEYQKS